jgi:hypothetical protein
MATTFTKIASNTVGVLGASTVTFSSIPSTYTDLVIKWSLRDSSAGTSNNLFIKLNSVTTSQSIRYIAGNGSSASSASDTPLYVPGGAVSATATASTFSNCEIYIPNYASTSINKSVSVDTVSENNATAAIAALTAGLYASNSAITSIEFAPNGVVTFQQYSTFTLYGIKNS